MKKLLFFVISAFLLVPSLASAQIEGNIPGSPEPKLTCQTSARAVYLNSSTNKIEYSVAYSLKSDYALTVNLNTNITQENSIPVSSSGRVQLSVTNGQTRNVSVNGKTVFSTNVSSVNQNPVTVSARLGDISCGSIQVQIVRQASGSPQQFSSGSNVNAGTNTVIAPNSFEPVQPNFPQPDRDDANPQMANQNPTIPEPNVQDQNINNRINIPQQENNPDAPVSNQGDVAGQAGGSAVVPGSQNTVSGSGSANAGAEIPNNPKNDPEITAQNQRANDLATEQMAVDAEQNRMVMYVMIAMIALLLGVITYLLVKKN